MSDRNVVQGPGGPDAAGASPGDAEWGGEDSGGMGSTTGATANRHSAGPSGMGQSSGRGSDAIRDPERMSGGASRHATDADFGAGAGRPSGEGGSFATSDPGMADEPVEGGDDEARE